MYSYLCAAWQLLTQPELATWLDAPGEPILSPLNRYLSYNLDRWTRNEAPSRVYPATETGSGPSGPSYVSTGAIRHINHHFSTTAAFTAAAILVHRSATPGFTAGPENLARAVPATFDAGGKLDTHVYEPCEPGTWYIRSRWISADGKVLYAPRQTTCTVTDI